METVKNFKALKTSTYPTYRHVGRFDQNLTLRDWQTGKKMKYGLYQQELIREKGSTFGC